MAPSASESVSPPFFLICSVFVYHIFSWVYILGGLSGRFESSQIPARCMVSDLTISFLLLEPEIRIYLIDSGICSFLLVSLSVGECILWRVGIRAWSRGTPAYVRFLLSWSLRLNLSSLFAFVFVICDLCLLWRIY